MIAPGTRHSNCPEGSSRHSAILLCRFLSLCRQGGYLSEYEMYFAYMFSFHRHALFWHSLVADCGP